MFNVAASHFLPSCTAQCTQRLFKWLFTFGLLLYAHVAAPNSTSSWGHGTTGNTNRCFNCRTTDGAVIRIFIIKHHFKSNAAVVRRQRIWVCCLNIVLCSLLFGVQRVVPCEVWSRIPLWYVCVDPALVCSCCNKKNIWKRTEDGVILCVVFVMFLKSVFHSIFRSLSFLNSSSLRHQQLSVAILSLHVMLQKADTILLLCVWPTFECSMLYYNKKFIKFFNVESGLECVFWGENVENAVQMWSMWNKFHV